MINVIQSYVQIPCQLSKAPIVQLCWPKGAHLLQRDAARAAIGRRCRAPQGIPVIIYSVTFSILDLLENYFCPLRMRFKRRQVACAADEKCRTELQQVCNQHLYCFVLLTILQGETSPIYRAILHLIQGEDLPTRPGCT